MNSLLCLCTNPLGTIFFPMKWTNGKKAEHRGFRDGEGLKAYQRSAALGKTVQRRLEGGEGDLAIYQGHRVPRNANGNDYDDNDEEEEEERGTVTFDLDTINGNDNDTFVTVNDNASFGTFDDMDGNGSLDGERLETNQQ